MQTARLSGWIRLGIVASIVWGGLVFPMAYRNYPADPWRVVSQERVLSQSDIELAIELEAAKPNPNRSFLLYLLDIIKDIQNDNDRSAGVEIPDIGLVYFPIGMSDKIKQIVIQKVLVPQHARSLAIIRGEVKSIYPQDLEKLTVPQLLNLEKLSGQSTKERIAYLKNNENEKLARLEKIHQAQVRHCLEALAWWLGGVFFLFGGGWTIRWIYRGFRKADI